MENTTDITAFLDDWRDGDRHALIRLFPLVHRELKQMVSQQLRQVASVDTISPTALVNEAFLKLIEQNRIRWRDRNHFLVVCATAMRRILVEFALSGQTRDRDDHRRYDSGDEGRPETRRADKLLALDHALTRLARMEARMARVVEMRFFGGLTAAEVAGLLDISEHTAKHDWCKARALLSLALAESQSRTPALLASA